MHAFREEAIEKRIDKLEHEAVLQARETLVREILALKLTDHARYLLAFLLFNDAIQAVVALSAEVARIVQLPDVAQRFQKVRTLDLGL